MPSESSPISFVTNENRNPILFIFLGASNLSRSFDGLKNCISRCLSPRSVSFIHAMGPGRGYISHGGILNTIYPPILSCDIFKAAHNKIRGNQQVIALITDIGNDIMYGVSTEEIIAGLKSVFASLNELKANIFITSIPVDLKQGIGELYFRVLRQIFFRKSHVELYQASEAIKTINKFIVQSLNENIILIDGMEQFCGIDKIHYSLLKSQHAWSHIAEKLIYNLNVNLPPKLKASEVMFSLANNLTRILFSDILKLVKKTNETY